MLLACPLWPVWYIFHCNLKHKPNHANWIYLFNCLICDILQWNLVCIQDKFNSIILPHLTICCYIFIDKTTCLNSKMADKSNRNGKRTSNIWANYSDFFNNKIYFAIYLFWKLFRAWHFILCVRKWDVSWTLRLLLHWLRISWSRYQAGTNNARHYQSQLDRFCWSAANSQRAEAPGDCTLAWVELSIHPGQCTKGQCTNRAV